MEKTKTSKKALRSLISDSMHEALKGLELPTPSKKVEKVLKRDSKKLAEVFANLIKRESKKQKKAARFMEDAAHRKNKKNRKAVGYQPNALESV